MLDSVEWTPPHLCKDYLLKNSFDYLTKTVHACVKFSREK